MDSDIRQNLRGCLICLLILVAVGGWIAYKGVPRWPWAKATPTPTPTPTPTATPEAVVAKQPQWFDFQNDYRHVVSLAGELSSRCRYSGDINGDQVAAAAWSLWASQFRMSTDDLRKEINERYGPMNDSNPVRRAADELIRVVNALPGLLSLCENVVRKRSSPLAWQSVCEREISRRLGLARMQAGDNNIGLPPMSCR